MSVEYIEGSTLPPELIERMLAKAEALGNVSAELVVIYEVDPAQQPPPIIDPGGEGPTEPPAIEYLKGRAIAKPTKDHVILWIIDDWNNAHLKEPPQERGAMLAHPADMADRVFVDDSATVLLYPDSIKVDGGGQAHEVHAIYEATIARKFYIKNTEIELI